MPCLGIEKSKTMRKLYLFLYESNATSQEAFNKWKDVVPVPSGQRQVFLYNVISDRFMKSICEYLPPLPIFGTTFLQCQILNHIQTDPHAFAHHFIRQHINSGHSETIETRRCLADGIIEC